MTKTSKQIVKRLGQPQEKKTLKVTKAPLKILSLRIKCRFCGESFLRQNYMRHLERKHTCQTDVLYRQNFYEHSQTITRDTNSKIRSNNYQLRMRPKSSNKALAQSSPSIEEAKIHQNEPVEEDKVQIDTSTKSQCEVKRAIPSSFDYLTDSSDEEVKREQLHSNKNCPTCGGNCLFDESKSLYEYSHIPTKYRGIASFIEPMRQVDDLKIDLIPYEVKQRMPIVREYSILDSSPIPEWKTYSIYVHGYDLELLRRLLVGYTKVYLHNRMNKDYIKLATKCSQTTSLFCKISTHIFEKYYLPYIRRQILKVFSDIVDDNNVILRDEFEHVRRLGRFRLSIYDFLGLARPVKNGFRCRMLWAPARFGTKKDIKRNTDHSIKTTCQLIKSADSVVRLLTTLVENFIYFKHDINSVKHDCLKMALNSLFNRIKSLTRCKDKHYEIHQMVKGVSEAAYLIFEKAITVQKGSYSDIHLKYSSDNQEYKKIFKVYYNRKPNKRERYVMNLLGFVPSLFFKQPCKLADTYLLQKRGQDVFLFADCDCQDHAYMNPIKYTESLRFQP